MDFAGCLTGCDADALVRRKLIRDVQRALAPVVEVAFTAPATADAATFLALLSPAVTVLALRRARGAAPASGSVPELALPPSLRSRSHSAFLICPTPARFLAVRPED